MVSNIYFASWLKKHLRGHNWYLCIILSIINTPIFYQYANTQRILRFFSSSIEKDSALTILTFYEIFIAIIVSLEIWFWVTTVLVTKICNQLQIC